MKSISVIVATYNGERFLKEQVDSLLAQTRAPDQIIFVDDCSTDNTFRILEDYQRSDRSIQLYKNETNQGVVRTFESGLRYANGDILFLCDQDDIWDTRKIEVFLKAFDDKRCVCVLSNADVFYTSKLTSHRYNDNNFVLHSSLISQLYKNQFIGCCMAFTKTVCEKALPFPVGISMHDWWLASVSIGLGRIRYIDLPLIRYRRHSSNLSSMNRRPLIKIVLSRVRNLFALFKLLGR